MDERKEVGSQKESEDLPLDGQVSRRRFLTIAGLAGATLAVGGGVGGLLAGCGSGSTSTTTTASGSSATASKTPKHGGTLRIGSPTIGGNIGWPATATGTNSVAQYYYETLLRGDEKGNLQPWLAESYKVAEDRKSITFTVRKGVKFHDGSDLTAEVVKWNLDIYVKTVPQIGSVEVVDPYTVRVAFKTWDNSLPSTFADANSAFQMVSKAAYDKNGQAWITTHPVGTGPFTVAGQASDANMKLVKNPNYWATDGAGNKLPYLDEVDFVFVDAADTQENMAKAGEIDLVTPIYPGRQAADYQKLGWSVSTSPDVNDVWAPDSGHADSPWSNQKVREAAEYAVDRASIAKLFGYGYLKAPNQIPCRSTLAYDPNYALGRNYDPAKAKQLLAEAGYPKGFSTKLIAWPGANKDIVTAEQQYLLAVGIRADLEFPPMGKWVTYIAPGGGWHNAIMEAPSPAGGATGIGNLNLAVSMFGANLEKSPEFTQALAAATSSPTVDVDLIRTAANILIKNALVIPVWEIGSGLTSQKYVTADFGRRGLPVFYSVEKVWLNK